MSEDAPAVVAVTGAAGKTGRAVTAALRARGARVRALARNEAQAAQISAEHADGVEVVVGDMAEASSLRRLLEGAGAIYHICPNMHPDEVEIGSAVIAAAQEVSRRGGLPIHIVYHSVLHPQTPEMPHHWRKLLVEGLLWRSGLPVTILQPAAYMQNVLAGRNRIAGEGIHAVPYAVGTRVGMVDLNEVAEVAARVICEAGHSNATYELTNGEALTQEEVAAALSTATGRPVRAVETPCAEWRASAAAGGIPAATIETLTQMFAYYEAYGFRGGAQTLRMLLGREAVRFLEWAQRMEWG